jgi:hypothetical protein
VNEAYWIHLFWYLPRIGASPPVPDDLKPVFRRFVDEYEYLTSIHCGRGYVAYKVLPDLVLAGWRLSASGVKEVSCYR